MKKVDLFANDCLVESDELGGIKKRGAEASGVARRPKLEISRDCRGSFSEVLDMKS